MDSVGLFSNIKMAESDDMAAFMAPPADDNAFAAPPVDDFVGDVNAAGSAEDNAPIILAAAPYEAPPAAVEDNAFAEAPAGVETVSDDEEEAPATNVLVSAEPTPMSKWNDEWQTTLLTRKDEENATKASTVEKAREDIEKFQAEREKRREARMAKNRSDEQDKLEAIEADLENDNSWQRVVKMIELNQDSSDGAVDTGRMKDVLVLLKNEPKMADALGA